MEEENIKRLEECVVALGDANRALIALELIKGIEDKIGDPIRFVIIELIDIVAIEKEARKPSGSRGSD